jgi:Beta-lactamase enzyme family
MKKFLLLVFTSFTLQGVLAQAKTDRCLLKILQKNSDKFASILSEPDKYRVQILYTQIDRDKKNLPKFTSYAYRLNKDEYFYPASTVKFPACLLALEKRNIISAKPDKTYINNEDIMISDSAYEKQIKMQRDETNLKNGGYPSLAHYIKKILLVSDNDAFNRLYEFRGQEDFNETLHNKGYKDVRIVHRLSVPMSKEQNSRSNPIYFLRNTNGRMDTIYKQPMLVASKKFESYKTIELGKGYMTAGKNFYAGDSLVNKPFNFTSKNYFALEDQQAILRAMLFPEGVKPEQRFNLTDEDYKFMYKYMSMSPMECNSPVYRTDTSMYDSYCKFLMFGDNKSPMPKNIRIFNKVGDAYGFLLDNAYIVDFDKNVEFMLSVVIYCNADEIFNDDKYDYETVGFPFMANLGKVIYDYELKRKRKVKPNLAKFKIDYTN